MFDEQTGVNAGTTTAPAFNRAKMKHDIATTVILGLLLLTSISYGARSGWEYGGIGWAVFYGALTGLLCEGFAWVCFQGLRASTGRLQMVIAAFGMVAGAGAGAVISIVELRLVFAADGLVSTALRIMAVIGILYTYGYRVGDSLQWAIMQLRIHANGEIYSKIKDLQSEATTAALDDVADDMAVNFKILIRSVANSIIPHTVNEGDLTTRKIFRWLGFHYTNAVNRITRIGVNDS